MSEDHLKSNSGKFTPNITESLDRLAEELASNYCTVSFGERVKAGVKLRDILNTEGMLFKSFKDSNSESVSVIPQRRNILVIGAGATFDSYRCIPLGQQVIDSFNQKYGGKIEDFPAIKQRFENYNAEMLIKNDVIDFENSLAMFAELILTPEELRKEISEMYNFKYSPSLFYEIIAHLFKHSFIDVIINFNFDELLDRTIQEELGAENYFHILSDGDCISIEDVMVDGRLKIPIYIKPHGTVSHKSSLRFTKRHYLDVPQTIKDLLKALVSGQKSGLENGTQQTLIQRVNIISVGFNMASIEFNDILNNYLPKESKIYHFTFSHKDDRDPNFICKLLPKFYERAFSHWVVEKNSGIVESDLGEFDKCIYERISISMFLPGKKNDLTTPLSELFSYIWRQVYDQFRSDLKPRSIARHEIISYLFIKPYFFLDDKKSSRKELRKCFEDNLDYYLDRTIVEIAVAINRNNGIIEIAQLLGDRVGIYYSLYRKAFFALNRTENGILSIYDLISIFVPARKLKLIETSYSKNIFVLDTSILADLKLDQAIMDEAKVRDSFTSRLISKKMKKWIIIDFVVSSKNVPEIKSIDTALAEDMIRKFARMIARPDEYNSVCVTVLYFLFTCRYLSQGFVENFKCNFKKIVYNSKAYSSLKFGNQFIQDEECEGLTMIDELTRLFNKSTPNHYYTISPKYNDPKNYLTESFSKSKILHTNLALDYMFRNMLLTKAKHWDIALMIVENGSLLNFLNFQPGHAFDLAQKDIYIINAWEAIRQIHPDCDLNELNQLRNSHYQELFGKVSIPGKFPKIRTFSIPSIQHNHHMMIFLKRIDNFSKTDEYPAYEAKVDEKVKTLKMVGALYMYRPGFSNNVNPICIGIHPFGQADNISALSYDFKKLLRIFTFYFWRSMAFAKVNEIDKLKVRFTDYLSWSEVEEKENIDKFVAFLFDSEEIKFTHAATDL